MHHPALLALGLTGLLLAGCAAPRADLGDTIAPVQGMTILGLVQDETFAPVAGATASVRLTNLTATTDEGGLFRFQGLPLGPYLVDVAAPGFEAATLNAEPQQNVSLNFVLREDGGLAAFTETFHFTGILRCAFEAVIISPSCDTALEYGGGPSVTEDIATFEAALQRGWLTAVADLDFDPEAHPGLAGLRLTVRGRSDDNAAGSYDQYGRFHDAGPFSTRLEPDASYPDGLAPLPANATLLSFEVYPHSHAYHPACEPVTNQCPLGVGAGMDVTFDLYLTVFYGLPAPDGFTLLG